MTLEETFQPLADKGSLTYTALTAIENALRDVDLKLDGDSEEAIHEALWNALGRVEVHPA